MHIAQFCYQFFRRRMIWTEGALLDRIMRRLTTVEQIVQCHGRDALLVPNHAVRVSRR